MPAPNFTLNTNKDLADTLGVSVGRLTYYAFQLPDDKKYRTFHIRKKCGGERLIEAPVKGLKDIQKSIVEYLENFFSPRACVFAYVKSRGIVEHATVHVNQRWILRIDLQDFFNTITRKRIAGLFRAPPFSFGDDAARTLSFLCTKNGRLTQGAPTSPILSNFICRGLDYRLKELAAKNKCYYTRYADDIFMSHSGGVFPAALAERQGDGLVDLSGTLTHVVETSGFTVNRSKSYLRNKAERQIVTGIVVNRKTNVPKQFIKNVRSALYSWEKFGLDAAENHWRTNIDKKNRYESAVPSFRLVLRGQINHVGHVKGYADPTYVSFARRLKALDPGFKLDEAKIISSITEEIHIYAEGVTDNKHLEFALRSLRKKGQFASLNLKFKATKKNGSPALKTLCDNLSQALQKHLTICVFDRDEPDIINSMGGSPGSYKDHGNNVFSLVIPVPDFRETKMVCIEHLYTDEFLFQWDGQGRRLFGKEEFDSMSCFKEDIALFCRYPNKQSLIYDSDVINIAEKKSVALSKNGFADYVIAGVPPFHEPSLDGFVGVFTQIEQILSSYK